MLNVNGKTIDLDGMRLELYSAEWKDGPKWAPITDDGKDGPIHTFWPEGSQILVLDAPEEWSDIVAYILDGSDLSGRQYVVVKESRHILHRVYKGRHPDIRERIEQMRSEGKFSALI